MTLIMKLIISIILFISIISSSGGQIVNVTTSFDSSRIFIGDQVKFTIAIDQPSDLRLSFPVFKDTLCKNILILSGPDIDSSDNQNGRIKIVERYLITSFDSGLYQISPVFAEMKNESGLKRFYSDYSQIEVMRVRIAPADTTAKIFDIIKPYRAPLTIGEVLPWVLLVSLFAVLVWAVIKLIRKLKKPETDVGTIIDPDPAHIIALRELERLRNEELWQKGEIKNYYTRLTGILRQYLENRFRVYSLELTTYETLDALVKSGFKKDGSYKLLKTILTGADLVKFAKYNPEPAENEAHFQYSRDFVMATKEDEVSIVAVDDKDNTREEGI